MTWHEFWDRWCLLAKAKAAWVSHGTRILGFGTSAFGALAFLDKATIDTIGKLAGHYEPYVVRGLMAAVGLAVAYRGFSNSRRP